MSELSDLAARYRGLNRDWNEAFKAADTAAMARINAEMAEVDAKLDAVETAKPRTFADGFAQAYDAATDIVTVCAIANAPAHTALDLVGKKATVSETIAAIRHRAH